MQNAKSSEDYTAKGTVSHTLGDRRYFGDGSQNIVHHNASFYGNANINIFKKNQPI